MSICMKAYMKKNDIILIIVLIVLSLFFVLILQFTKKEGTSLLVFIDGNEYKSFDLSEELSFTIELEDGNYNSFEIKDGYVKMISASCPDKICLHTKGIYYDKETITCLPNRVLLQVSGGESSEIDAVVN